MTNKQVIRALKISDINVNDIRLSPHKTNKRVPISYNGEPLVFQTPYLRMSCDPIKTRYPDMYEIHTLFEGDTKEKIKQWFNFLESFEGNVSMQADKHLDEWFLNKKITVKSFIREQDGDKPLYYIKWAIDFKIDFLDPDKNDFDPLSLREGDLVRLIVSIDNLWISEDQCGLYVVVQKVMVKPYEETIETEYHFNSDSDQEEDKVISVLATEQKPKSKVPFTGPESKDSPKSKKLSESKSNKLVINKNAKAKSSLKDIFSEISDEDFP